MPITFLIITQIKRVIPCYKKHDTSFIWYYYTYHISKAILDLDPDLCENFLFVVTSSILHIETCMIPLSKAVHKGFISFHTPKSSELFMGTLWPQNWKKLSFLLVSVSFLHIEWSVIRPLKAFMKDFISSSYTDELWAIYEDIMT